MSKIEKFCVICLAPLTKRTRKNYHKHCLKKNPRDKRRPKDL